MTAKTVALIGGGARSGKSAFALARARSLGVRPTLLATAEALDGEMRARIALHRRERGDAFATVEEPIAVPAALEALQGSDAVVIDCLTLWLSNLLLRDQTEPQILAEVDALCDVLQARRVHAIVVSNEVGMGIVPETALGRTFRDLAGLAHQRIASCADELYVAAVGCVLRVRPGPVEAVAMGGIPCGT